MLATHLYKLGEPSYRFLSKIFRLPSKTMVLKFLRKFKLTPGINRFIFAHLNKARNRISDEDKICVVVFDEMSVVPNLTHFKDSGCIRGMEEYGSTHRTNNLASNCLIF